MMVTMRRARCPAGAGPWQQLAVANQTWCGLRPLTSLRCCLKEPTMAYGLPLGCVGASANVKHPEFATSVQWWLVARR